MSSDPFRIDSHKLMFHPQRLFDWQQGKAAYPMYLEISPSGSCNHRCIYCALDFLNYRPSFLNPLLLKKRLGEMASLGVKSIMYAGEGEPLLHPHIADIVGYTKNAGIDTALTTNGVLLGKKFVDTALKDLCWIKISVNGATNSTYRLIHQAGPQDLKKVLENISYAVKVKKRLRLSCTLGMQLLLLPENAHEVLLLARLAKNLGVDYFVVKPYSQHPLSKTIRYKDIKYRRYLELRNTLERYTNKSFNALFRVHAMKKWDTPARSYRHCLALAFWAYIDAEANVWACSMYLTKKNFKLGNLSRQSYGEICKSVKRRNLLRWAACTLDTTRCRVNCRMDEVNRYLWDLTHPPEHVNFI